MKDTDTDMPTLHPAQAREIIAGLRWYAEDMTADDLLEIRHLAARALALRNTRRKRYGELLAEVVAMAQAIPGTGGHRALRKIVFDLEGDGALGELLHTLDTPRYLQVMEMLREFRISGIAEPFNRLHAEARQALE